MPKKKSSSKKDFVENAFSVAMRSVGIEQKPAEIVNHPIVGALSDLDIRRGIMQEMGRRGGKKGGKARAKSMTAKQRSDTAKKAALARWSKPKQK